MTLAIFPTLDGIEWNTVKRPEFKTVVFEALSGNESRCKMRQYPKYTFKLSFEFLIRNRDEDQLTELMSFMLNRAGMYGAFLYADPDDYTTADDELFGTGDGSTTTFQLTRNYGGFTEPVQNLSDSIQAKRGMIATEPGADASIYIYGVRDSIVYLFEEGVDYTMSSTGLIDTSAGSGPWTPLIGDSLYWQGNFYYRVRFLSDGYDFTQTMKNLYECREIEFIGSVRNAV